MIFLPNCEDFSSNCGDFGPIFEDFENPCNSQFLKIPSISSQFARKNCEDSANRRKFWILNFSSQIARKFKLRRNLNCEEIARNSKIRVLFSPQILFCEDFCRFRWNCEDQNFKKSSQNLQNFLAISYFDEIAKKLRGFDSISKILARNEFITMDFLNRHAGYWQSCRLIFDKSIP